MDAACAGFFCASHSVAFGQESDAHGQPVPDECHGPWFDLNHTPCCLLLNLFIPDPLPAPLSVMLGRDSVEPLCINVMPASRLHPAIETGSGARHVTFMESEEPGFIGKQSQRSPINQIAGSLQAI